jgi:gamma-glutamylcyclotransferase (GGCT)/AIG2-like uncharacterized protein YtfP
MTDSSNHNITLETYKLKLCDKTTMRALDSYEGYPSLYDKKLVTLKSGIESCIYYMNSEEKSYHGELIQSGDWQKR